MARNISEKARDFAIECHTRVNQLYDGEPYHIGHLEPVVAIGRQFAYLIPEEDYLTVEGGLWCHDTLEDTGITFNDLKKATSEGVANIAYALTNEKGRTRKERANSKYYRGIRQTEYAQYAKLCDRLGNLIKSLKTGSTMLKIYRAEHPDFVKNITKTSLFEKILILLHLKKKFQYNDMIIYMEKLLS